MWSILYKMTIEFSCLKLYTVKEIQNVRPADGRKERHPMNRNLIACVSFRYFTKVRFAGRYYLALKWENA